MNQDRQRIERFIRFYGAQKKLHTRTRTKYTYSLNKFIEILESKNLTIANLSEMQALELLEHLSGTEWSEPTRDDYWDRFKRFYKWCYKKEGPFNEDTYELLFGEEPLTYRVDRNQLREKDTLSIEEVVKLVHAEPDLRYKALISTVYETGIRASEAFNIRLKDVKEAQNKHGFDIWISHSKTDKRPVPVIHFSKNYLRKWLQVHPFAADKEAHLFLNERDHMLTYACVNKRLRSLINRLDIDKRISCHSLRHSRATWCADQGMGEGRMCALFGWRIGSRQVARYVHKSGINTRRALEEIHGISGPEKRSENIGHVCIQCEHPNPFSAEVCDNCSLPLDPNKLNKLRSNVKAINWYERFLKQFQEREAELIESITVSVLQRVKE